MIDVPQLYHAVTLIEMRRAMLSHLHTLNAINGGDPFAFPADVFKYVNTEDLAKGVTVLLVGEIAKIETALRELGIKLDAPVE